MADLFFNGIGFLGLGLFLWAYAMINLGKWDTRNPRPHACNLAGALLIMGSLMHHWNMPVFVLECIWASISIYGLWKARKTA